MTYCVECKPDRLLVKKLTIATNKPIVHSGNKTKVLYDLLNNYESSIGLVDEDPHSTKPALMSYFGAPKNVKNCDLEILIDECRNNKLVVIKPRLEEWILTAANKTGIDIRKDFNLPNNGQDLHSIININLDRYEKLIECLQEKNNIYLSTLTQILNDY